MDTLTLTKEAKIYNGEKSFFNKWRGFPKTDELRIKE